MTELSIDQYQLLYSIVAGYPLAAPGDVWDALVDRGLVELRPGSSVSQPFFIATVLGYQTLGVSAE